MRRWFVVIVFSLLMIVGQAAAQDSSWTAWFYAAANGRAVQVDSGGNVLHDVQLPLPETYLAETVTFLSRLAVSHDGTRLAYTVTGQDTSGAAVTTLMVYDVPTAAIVTTYQPPITPEMDVLDVPYQPRLFNLTGGAVAYEYVTLQMWRVVVIDTLTGGVLAEIDQNHPAVQPQNPDALLVPVVHFYEGATVSFSLVNTDAAPTNQEEDSFAWDAITGRVVRSNQFPNIWGDYLPRVGESVVPVFDERVTYLAEAAPYANALHVYRPEVGGRAPFFASTTLDLQQADFVQNGEMVVAQATVLADGSTAWLLIDRSGVSQSLPAINALDGDIIGTPDGFIYTLDGTPQIAIAVNTRTPENDQLPLWVAPAATSFLPVWVTPPERDATRTSWAQLAPPVFTTQAILEPVDTGGITASEVATATPSGRGVLTVNGVAIISTTEGDRLNMRNQPGLNTSIIARLDNGTRVVLLDGPIASDGFTWWEVRLNTGLTGWVVESAENVRTLIPAG